MKVTISARRIALCRCERERYDRNSNRPVEPDHLRALGHCRPQREPLPPLASDFDSRHLISGALATLLAADAALGTRVVAPNIAAASTGELPGDLPSGWKAVCGIIAIFTFAGTVSQGIHTLLKVAEHQAKSLECAGKLDALAIQSSQAEPAQNENLKAELAKLLRDYPEYVREV